MDAVWNINTEMYQKWVNACLALDREFGLDPDLVPLDGLIRQSFYVVVSEYRLTQQAANALLYSLFFYGYLNVLDKLHGEDASFEMPDLKDLTVILDSADHWASQAADFENYQRVAQPIYSNTQALIRKLWSH